MADIQNGAICARLDLDEKPATLWRVIALGQKRARVQRIDTGEIETVARDDLWVLLDSFTA